MFIDDIKNTYIYLDTLKRVVWENPNDRIISRDLAVTAHPAMLPLFHRLLRDRPTWRFKSTTPAYANTTRIETKEFRIYDIDEEIGTVRVEYHWSNPEQPRYYFSNHRLKLVRQRRGEPYSTKIEVAAKRILKAFHLKTPSERASEAFHSVRGVISTTNSKSYSRISRARQQIERAAYDYAAKNWDSFVALIGEPVKDLDYPEVLRNAAEVAELATALAGHTGTLIRLEANDSYMVAQSQESGGYIVRHYNDATMPEHLLTPLGLLKMVDVGTFIPDIGIRAEHSLFFALPQPQEEAGG